MAVQAVKVSVTKRSSTAGTLSVKEISQPLLSTMGSAVRSA